MIGIISDIHGNYEGLEVVLGRLEQHHIDQIICLGDLVDGGSDPLLVINRIQTSGIRCVRGNHDICNNDHLPSPYQDWLNALPDELSIDGCYFTHISPRKRHIRKINDAVEAWNAFDETAERRVFIGHTHVSLIFGERSEHPVSATEIRFQFNRWLNLDRNDRYIISPGAVGYSRDSRKSLRYAIYDHNLDRIQIHEVPGPQIA